MDGVKVGGAANGKVGIDQHEDMGDGMQCSEHPYRNNPGGICAFCLQEKLGKLVSSASPLPLRGSTSSSSSPSFRSDVGSSATTTTTNTIGVGFSNVGNAGTSLSLAVPVHPTSSKTRNGIAYITHYREHPHIKSKLPFLLPKKKKKMTATTTVPSESTVVFNRSKSTASGRNGGHFLDTPSHHPRRRSGFWSFLYPSSSSTSSSHKKADKVSSISPTTNGQHYPPQKSSGGSNLSRRAAAADISVVVEDEETVIDDNNNNSGSTPNSQATASVSSFERKVSRSRSVGCGSRSFSGDFFERISTGFGDCTLRRVESHREGKPRGGGVHSGGPSSNIKERVRCGGIFSGLMINSSSEDLINGKSMVPHWRPSRSWAWAFASPMRAFTKPPGSKDGKREHIIREASNRNTTTAPNLSAIPSLLAVGG